MQGQRVSSFELRRYGGARAFAKLARLTYGRLCLPMLVPSPAATTSRATLLGDLTVLEVGEAIPGAYCGKLLAGLGARVIKVEPPGGGPSRFLAPFAGDVSHVERSATFLYLNTAKRSIVLDLAEPSGQAAFRRLASRADVVVESHAPAVLARLGVDYGALSAINPRLIVASIAPFGQDGPYRDYLTSEIVAEALGGLLFTIGVPGREPLKMGGTPALYSAGGAAFSAIMAAVWQRDRTGQGQHIDLSIQEATALTQIHASIEATWLGTDTQRTLGELVEARDGWVSTGLETGVSPETWPRVCELLGRPELIDDPRFASSAARRDHREALKAVVGEWVRSQAKEDVYHLLQGLRSIAGYVATTADLYRAKQLEARAYFQDVEHPIAGRARYPGLPFRIGDEPWTVGRAPLLGEHTASIEAELAAPESPSSARGSRPASPAMSCYALDGVRVLDLTQVAVGPYATFLLSGLGAQVIKVESHRRPDTARGPVRPAGVHQMKQYPRMEPGARPWNRGAHFNQRNRGKLGITLDLTASAGKEIFKRLVARSDVVIENYRASVMERQGLGWDVLRAVNPRLVYVKLSSQGDSGPERDYGSLGSTLEQTAGLASITGYLDRVPLTTNRVYPDPVAGVLAVGALILALRQARRDGVGRLVDCSQREVTVGLLGEAMMDYAFNGRVQEPAGNRSANAAPQGVYACAGGEQWIAIAVESDAQWRSLRAAMGDPVWARDVGLETLAGRRACHDEIDAALAAWTSGFGHYELMHRLQRRGVPAGAVLTGRELLRDPQLEARGWWEEVVPPEVGEPHRFVTAPWRLSASPFRPSTPAPLLGEHNDQVYREILELSADDYAVLRKADVIGTEPLWTRA
jgi:crotonobetainyl-CoA:carnitine CoA-transferase CaiB-like acyl-CoA transferase